MIGEWLATGNTLELKMRMVHTFNRVHRCDIYRLRFERRADFDFFARRAGFLARRAAFLRTTRRDFLADLRRTVFRALRAVFRRFAIVVFTSVPVNTQCSVNFSIPFSGLFTI